MEKDYNSIIEANLSLIDAIERLSDAMYMNKNLYVGLNVMKYLSDVEEKHNIQADDLLSHKVEEFPFENMEYIDMLSELPNSEREKMLEKLEWELIIDRYENVSLNYFSVLWDTDEYIKAYEPEVANIYIEAINDMIENKISKEKRTLK